MDAIIRYGLRGGMPVLLLVLSLSLGFIALTFMPREEEPQIVVPVVDVMVASPGISAPQVERQVTIPLEKLLAQIPGVEHVYSTSNTGHTLVTLRFHVGQDREEAILNTYNKLHSNQDHIPAVVSDWMVSPVEVDDVPILMLGLWTTAPERTSDYELRRVADEVATYIQAIDNTSEVNVVGGRPRTIRILLDPESLAARQSTPVDVINAIQVSNVLGSAGNWTLGHDVFQLEAGGFIGSPGELRELVVNVVDGQPVFLQDVAHVADGPAEPVSYTWLDFAGPGSGPGQSPMVAISVAKQRGSNAVQVAVDVHDLLADIEATFLPSDVRIKVLRDYGATADEKVNQLTTSLAFAVFTVVVFIAVFLGIRPALVVGIAVPMSYGITLALDLAFGYTINRVTLFALILALGLLVDDPITGIDNISRFLREKTGSATDRIVGAISEIKVPLLMSTVTIILAFLPLAFITGMMGPYMAPMAFNVPVSVMMSTVVAFLVTPWLAKRILRDDDHARQAETADNGTLRLYRRVLQPLLQDRRKAKLALWLVLLLFVAAAMLPVLRLVPLKLLPFDNKNEIQVLIDMPETATLEETAAMAVKVSDITRRLVEVDAVAAFVGVASPIDFNGMVRRYYQRNLPHLADLRVTLVDKAERVHQSHGVVLRLRSLLAPLAVDGVSLKVVEVPPGPPVFSTLVAEVYGTPLTPYEALRDAAGQVAARLSREPHVVEVDTGIEADQQRLRFVVDRQKAALSGVATTDITRTLAIANEGEVAGYLQLPAEARPLPMELRLAFDDRTSAPDLERLHVKGRPGATQARSASGLDAAPQPLVAIGELGEFMALPRDKAIHRKDLTPVVYVMAELSGRTPVEIISDVYTDLGAPAGEGNDWQWRTFLAPGAGDGWQVPAGIDVVWTGEGEWKITVDVFRDMGLGYLFALIGIFFVLKLQTGSNALSAIIMSAIPLTVIGIMPGFWLLNQFGEREIAGAPEPLLFTATAMIGMIALAGIVVRNSLILVEFIGQARAEGMPINEALVQAGAIRMRPILLTAGTTLLGNLVITLDPVFSGLALAIIFGIIAATLFTLLVVPIVYMLVFAEPANEGETP